ncbi:MAG: DUF4339 domain-containing protein [Deltaproteobacteria bacterium]|nr:MAG: DUF4339 domain-containing protein [Deltaproteobacteria bacterium]
MAANKSTTIQDLWHYAVGSERKGPVPRATLGSLLAAGEISSETYVWQPGMENWVHLGDADPLKELVAGVGGDQPVEVFIEEDTAFNTADELLATHHALAAGDGAEEEAADAAPAADFTYDVVDEASEVGGDTIVESVDDVFGSITTDYEPEGDEVTLIGADAGVFAAAAAAVDEVAEEPEAEPFAVTAEEPAVVASAGEAAAAASGIDIFGDADADDIFAEASDEPVQMTGSLGAHSRHANSVLFSLDDLGRDDAKDAPAGGGDPFVTDTSGLIDIKAIADSQEERHDYGDPFAVPTAPVAPRAGTIAIPIVERRRSLGPWILAAAVILLVGGGIVAFTLMGDDTPKPDPVAMAALETRAKAAEAEAAAAKAAAEAQAAEAKAAEEARVAAEKAAAEAKAAEQAKAAEEAKVAAAGEAKTEGGEEPAAGDVVAKADTTPKARTPKVHRTTPKTTPTTTTPEPKDTTPEPTIEVAAAPKTTTSSGNTRKVNALLEKLNNPGEGTTTTSAADTNMPKKLSAASLRQTLRQNRARFAKCGQSLGADAGSVKVTTSFVIQGATGAVQSARIVNGGGTSPEVQRCVVSELKNTVFGRFSDATMTVNFPIQLL